MSSKVFGANRLVKEFATKG